MVFMQVKYAYTFYSLLCSTCEMSNVNIYEGGLVCIQVFVSRIYNSMSSEEFVVDLWMKRRRVNIT